MGTKRKYLLQRVSVVLLRYCFNEYVLHHYFRSGNSKIDIIATYDLIDVSQQSCVDLGEFDGTIGIVIQGPIVQKTTLNFCKFIQATYPEVFVVLSTWECEDISQFKVLIGTKFKIIRSKKPEIAGPSNINLQIVSSKAGIEILERLGCSHILKTRTDIFLTNPQFLNYLIWAKSKGKSNAIVFSSFNSFIFRLFSISDQLMFGKTEEISKFWNLDLVGHEHTVSIPEVHLFLNYLKVSGFVPENNLTSYICALTDFVVIADHEQLGQIWNKGSFTALNYRWRGKKFPHPLSQWSYWLWELASRDDAYFKILNEKIT